MTPSGKQIKAARALLGWDRGDLAQKAKLSIMTIQFAENEESSPKPKTLEQIISAFRDYDVEFLGNEGVRKRDTNIVKLQGKEALTDLLDDVYWNVRNGGSICISGVDEDVFEDHYVVREERHSVRMAKLGNKVSVRALIKEGDLNIPYTSYVEYRWMPKEHFKENAFYLYNNKLAFIQFLPVGSDITLIESAAAAAAFRNLFDFTWANAIKPPISEKE